MTLDEDRELLTEVLEMELDEKLTAIFDDMLRRLDRFRKPLRPKQRAWASATFRGEKYVPEEEYENLVSEGRVPRGREVATIPILDPAKLPKKPPKRAP